MISRFQGEAGNKNLFDSLLRQRIIQGDETVCEKIASIVELIEIAPDEVLISQGDEDNTMYFILAGRLILTVHDRPIGFRKPGQHVGEMALIDPSSRRSASLIADEVTVVAKVTEPGFSAIAEDHPRLWRRLALEIADRLRQRNVFVRPRNPQPILFIGSSKEFLHVAQHIQAGLAHDDAIIRVWTDEVFRPSRFPIDDLLRQVIECDFAALVMSPDDILISRGSETLVPRDNIILELGLFLGVLSRERTYLIMPRHQEVSTPSDILGLTPITYQTGPNAELPSLLAHVCHVLRKQIEELGAR